MKNFFIAKMALTSPDLNGLPALKANLLTYQNYGLPFTVVISPAS